MYQLMYFELESAILARAVAQLPPPIIAIRALSELSLMGVSANTSEIEMFEFPHSMLSAIIWLNYDFTKITIEFGRLSGFLKMTSVIR